MTSLVMGSSGVKLCDYKGKHWGPRLNTAIVVHAVDEMLSDRIFICAFAVFLSPALSQHNVVMHRSHQIQHLRENLLRTNKTHTSTLRLSEGLFVKATIVLTIPEDPLHSAWQDAHAMPLMQR